MNPPGTASSSRTSTLASPARLGRWTRPVAHLLQALLHLALLVCGIGGVFLLMHNNMREKRIERTLRDIAQLQLVFSEEHGRFASSPEELGIPGLFSGTLLRFSNLAADRYRIHATSTDSAIYCTAIPARTGSLKIDCNLR